MAAENRTQSVIDAVRELSGAEVTDVTRAAVGDATVAILPSGKTVVDLKPILDNWLEKPERRKGTATLTDAASFVAHVNRFAAPASAVFANPRPDAPSLTAVFDYHEGGPDAKVADWLRHRATYAPQLSAEWKAWTGKQGQAMSQADFATFIEDRITDVVVPNLDDPKIKTFADLVQGKFASPSDLLQLSRGLSINVETGIKQAVTLSTGEISVRYEETHKDGEGAPISVANLFQICVPVFYAGPLYRIAARLRYRLHAGKITWSYLLARPDVVFDDAFRGIVERVTKETTAPVFLGSPEA